MCAINGITTENRMLVERMNRATLHRGPDGSEIWESEGITFGHNRLAIIDLSNDARQPMTSASKRYTIVFNGEIYNYRELREELCAMYTFNTQSDTEVLLAAYEHWGNELFPKLRGMFAFGIWDRDTKTLTLARDHMGIKPLYYSIENEALIFSSELPGILCGVQEKKLDPYAIGFYLSMEYVPAPKTLLSNIHKLKPGHVLRYSEDKKITIQSFYKPSFDHHKVSHGEIYSAIDTAVSRQMISDRPIGAYLSGGFDSSIVAYHMRQHTPDVKTYSVDFESVEGQEDESSKFNADARIAEKTAAFFNTRHTTFTISLRDVCSVLEHACARANEPVANSTAVTQFLLSDFVRKDGTVVVLGGDGGDELFGGYTRHKIMMGAYFYQKFPEWLQRIGNGINPRAIKLKIPFYTPLHMGLMAKDEKKILPFLRTAPPINVPITEFFNAEYAALPYPAKNHPLDTFMKVDRATWLPDECFVRSDYASMAHGLELRVPLVDLDLVKLSDQISVYRKTLPHQGKRIIRKAYRGILPEHLYREPKRGWLSPAAKWFRDPEIEKFTRSVFSSGYYNGLDQLFAWEHVQALLTDHIERRGYYLYPLWNILVLQIWARQNGITYESD